MAKATSAALDLICVDPARVQAIWPHVEPLIARAARRTGLSHSADIAAETLQGRGLLWLACEGRTIRAAATTVLTRTDAALVCILTACGGEGMRGFLPLLDGIEAYARAEGCAALRLYGRKGWARVLDGYRARHVVLQKEL